MFTLLFSASSCREDLKNLDPNPDTSLNNGRYEDGEKQTILGKKLNNPYSVKSMTETWKIIKKEYPKFRKTL